MGCGPAHGLLAFAIAIAILLQGCRDGDSAGSESPLGSGEPDISIPQSVGRDVDILFVIDNSGSMADEHEQANLIQQFPSLTQELRNMVGGMPNVHVGVTSTDLGTGMFQWTYCEDVGGDAGRLLVGRGNCANPTGVSYIVDVEARDCEIQRDSDTGICSSHQCDQSHCAFEPSTSLAADENTGCPRCRNYTGQTLEDVFSCVADLGTLGCGFEQPLEAMQLALEEGSDPAGANAGFVRDDALLAVVLISDEDDCSASNPQIFDTAWGCFNPWSPFTSFRCFEFGITCDINSHTHLGTRHNCRPRDDAAALLHPISRYTEFLESLKPPQLLVLAAIAGPVTPSADGEGVDVVVGLHPFDSSDSSYPKVEFSCTTSEDGAVPGIRMHALVEHFNDEPDMQWAYTSICNSDYTFALDRIGDKIRAILDDRCLPAPLRDCADPGAELGEADACPTNDECRPICLVTDVHGRGTDQEVATDIPPCLEVCPEGPCLGNTVRALAYELGHPMRRDPNLPVPFCWHINHQLACQASNGAEIIISRQQDPPARSFSDVWCHLMPPSTEVCNNGADDDQDCLVDAEDPDCQE